MTKRRLIGIAVAVCAVAGVALFAAAALGGVGSPRTPGTGAAKAGALAQAGSTSGAPGSAVAASASAGVSGSTNSGAPNKGAPTHVVSGGVAGPTITGPKGSARQPRVAAPVVPKPSGPVLADHVSVAGAATFVAAKGVTAPQTYAAVITPLGWQDKAAGSLVAKVISASLTAVSAAGEPIGSPPANVPDLSKQLEALTFVGATNPAVRADITHQQSYKVYLVLLPSGTGAVFVVDRLR